MRCVVGITLLVLLCGPVFAQTEPLQPDAGQADGRAEVQAEPAALPDAPSETRRSGGNGSEEAEADSAAPSAPSPLGKPYSPLTNREKLNHSLNAAVSPFILAAAGFNATWLQMNGVPRSYGGGMNGWGKRFGIKLVDTEVRTVFSQFLFPSVLNQDPRYFPQRQGGVLGRGWYAATRVVYGRHDSGKTAFNSSYLMSVVASRALANAYSAEEQRNLRTTLLSILGAYGADAGGLVLQEFWPDLRRLLGGRNTEDSGQKDSGQN